MSKGFLYAMMLVCAIFGYTQALLVLDYENTVDDLLKENDRLFQTCE